MISLLSQIFFPSAKLFVSSRKRAREEEEVPPAPPAKRISLGAGLAVPVEHPVSPAAAAAAATAAAAVAAADTAANAATAFETAQGPVFAKEVVPKSQPLPSPEALPSPNPQTLPSPKSQQPLPSPNPQTLPSPKAQPLPSPNPQTLPSPKAQPLPSPNPQTLPSPKAQPLPSPNPQTLPSPKAQQLLPSPKPRLPSPNPQTSPKPNLPSPAASPNASAAPPAVEEQSPQLQPKPETVSRKAVALTPSARREPLSQPTQDDFPLSSQRSLRGRGSKPPTTPAPMGRPRNSVEPGLSQTSLRPPALRVGDKVLVIREDKKIAPARILDINGAGAKLQYFIHQIGQAKRTDRWFMHSSVVPFFSDWQVFKIEKILDGRSSAEGREFLIKWSGFPDASNSWEPEANLNSQDVLQFVTAHPEKFPQS
eukprot:TRINITY_DN1989_c0_g1_i3.p1 TRINITY_DN1989_c0_g1~~TRINITY_DN1989_c0_g1_i3.p1  ORF type:complete len:423 (-),score=82.14 TRINITY_DN1989_c0_g1_i3:1-1269(-)